MDGLSNTDKEEVAQNTRTIVIKEEVVQKVADTMLEDLENNGIDPTADALNKFAHALETISVKVGDTILKATRALESLAASDTMKKLLDMFVDMANFLDEQSSRFEKGDFSVILSYFENEEEIKELLPYIEADVNAINADREFPITFLEYAGNHLENCIEKARAAHTIDLETADKLLPVAATIKRVTTIEYPLDKTSTSLFMGGLWRDIKEEDQGQLTFAFYVGKDKNKKPLNVIVSIDFNSIENEVKITKHLTEFDKRVYIAIAALHNAGNSVVSLTQIYYAMGNTSTPNASQRSKINDAITKMTGAKISISDLEVAKSFNCDTYTYDGFLLPVARISQIINGQFTDAAIKIQDELPLISFAKLRKQITTFDIKLLQAPISMTDTNLAIEDYLLDRIFTYKHQKVKSFKILFNTLYERVNLTTAKQRSRAPEKIQTYLDYWQSQGLIKKYTMAADNVVIYF